MSIGEFSKRSGLSLKRLRTYAGEGLLVPAAVDPASGYRYYSPEQVHLARVIEALRTAAMPLADIRSALRHGPGPDLDAWERRLETDAVARRQALERARRLLGDHDHPLDTTGGAGPVQTTTLRCAGRSETGPGRQNNEDAVVHGERIAVVADGMGGPPGGEIAAQLAAALVRAACTGASLYELGAAVRAANWAIWDRAGRQPELAGMGTTICAAALLDDGGVAVVHVGDSRAYLWHDGALVRLTRDHTVTADLVERGELSEAEAPGHPHFGILTRALGVAPEVTVDACVRAVAAGDRLLLCSDGLVNEVSDAEIAGAMASEEDPATLADHLVDAAVARGARDNASAVAAHVAASPPRPG